MSKKSNPSTPGEREPGIPGTSHELLQGATAMDPDETVVDVPDEQDVRMKRNPADYLMWDRGHVSSPEAGCNRERFAIFMEVELDLVMGNESGYRAVPQHTWNAQIITDYLQEVIKPITHVAVLNQSDCVIFSGNRMKKQGMTFDTARDATRRLNKIDNWVGKRVLVRAVPLTVADGRRAVAEADVFIRAQNAKRIVGKNKPPPEKNQPIPNVPRGRGMTRRADLYYAQKSQRPGLDRPDADVEALGRGAERLRLLDTATPNTPSEYGSAHEDVTETETSDAAVSEDDETEDDGTYSYDTDHSRFTTVADRNRRRNRARRRERRRVRQRGFRRNGGTQNQLMRLPVFRDGRKEGSLLYEDWRSDVSALISSGVDPIRIRDAVMQSLEGEPAKTAKMPYKKGRGTLREILATLDKVHGKSISYRSLNADLCTIRQHFDEDSTDYYKRLNSIVVMMEEHHEERFKEGELALTAKEAFYHGLRPEFRPMIAHMMENPTNTVADLLATVRDEEETEERLRGDRAKDRYRSKHSSRDKDHESRSGHRHHRDGYYGNDRKRDGTGIRVAQIGDDGDDSSDTDSTLTEDDREMIFKDAYYVGVARIADEDDKRTGRCFNCKEEGHQWRQCNRRLREDLRKVLERPGVDDKRLNRSGDGGKKGGRNPRREAAARTPEPAVPAQ